MKLHDVPPPEYTFGYRSPPESGNKINGLDVAENVPARKVYHGAAGMPPLAWHDLNKFSVMLISGTALWQGLLNRWQMRRSVGPVAKRRIEVDDKDAMAAKIKDLARKHGADLVGITELRDEALYADTLAWEDPRQYRYAICIGRAMNREEMLDVPGDRSQTEVQRRYKLVSRSAIRLSEEIRKLGWDARAFGDSKVSDVLHIPLAIQAGLGELGKHGSMICKEYGSNFRLSTVLTNLPMALDAPVDIGVDDLCVSCRRCTIDCPPDAITDQKRMVRGTRKWYVDFDKCVPYFAENRGCGICIEVCPWSEPGRGPALSEMLLKKRNAAGRPQAAG